MGARGVEPESVNVGWRLLRRYWMLYAIVVATWGFIGTGLSWMAVGTWFMLVADTKYDAAAFDDYLTLVFALGALGGGLLGFWVLHRALLGRHRKANRAEPEQTTIGDDVWPPAPEKPSV